MHSRIVSLPSFSTSLFGTKRTPVSPESGIWTYGLSNKHVLSDAPSTRDLGEKSAITTQGVCERIVFLARK